MDFLLGVPGERRKCWRQVAVALVCRIEGCGMREVFDLHRWGIKEKLASPQILLLVTWQVRDELVKFQPLLRLVLKAHL